MVRKLQTRQEEVIHDLSAFMLGAHAIFAPLHYGPNSNEPADVAWVGNRCAVLMYMTESRGSFEKKKNHNVKQLHRWLRKWKSGEHLRGRSASGEWSFSWGDIDHVIALSIIDGGEVGCQFHPEAVQHSIDYKLAACATFTGPVIERISKSGAGIRDLLDWLRLLQIRHPAKVDEDRLVAMIRAKSLSDSADVRASLNLVDYDTDLLNDGWHQAVGIFRAMRSSEKSADELGDLVHVFRSRDALWMGVAYYVLASQLAAPGQFGRLAARAQREIDGYQIRIFVFANGEVRSQHIKDILFDEPGLSLSLSLEFGFESPVVMGVSNKIPHPTPLEKEVQAMRDRATRLQI